MKLGHDMLFLSDADIAAADVSSRALADSVDTMLKAKAAGTTVTKPKLGIYPKPGTFFQAMAGALSAPAYAGVKWTGVIHDNDKRGLPHVSPLILLNDVATGLPLALMDGKWITTHRTAALTLVGARYLARPDSSTIGFVACGVQARSHLLTFREHFPLKRAVAYSRRRETAEAFAADVRETGMPIEVVSDPRKAVEGMDIVISSVPESPNLVPFIDPAWFSPGSYAGLLDVSRGVQWDRPFAFDVLATDDHEQSQSMVKSGRLKYPKPFDTDLADLAGGRKKGRTTATQRTGLVFSGLALADVAVAGAIYQGALKAGRGQVLPL
ncbi:MAG: ornithine cyclodeaminase family protein [Alphaproteobacteria bacterium]|nr:ornithine cyclodeaminase family protein [Alphaproteobacteria bacterium]